VAGPGDWKIVSSGLERSGAQVVFDADQSGQTVLASVLSEDTPGDYNAGIVYSPDGGDSWKWGGVLALPGRQFPEAIAAVDGGALLVGSSQTGDAGAEVSRAFMARGMAPDYVLKQVSLPKAFGGDGVHLQDVAVVGPEWVVVGYDIAGKDATGQQQPEGLIWTSSDAGANWNRRVINVKGLTSLAVKGMAVTPDGSWNVVGEGSSGDRVVQFDAVWLKSTDKGRTFTSVSPESITGDFDQAADRITFSSDGSSALVGWSELTDDHGGNVSALWVGSPGHGVQRIGGPRISVVPTTPEGEFLDGVMWQGKNPIAWGSTTGDYPMTDVQFWTLRGAQLEPTGVLPGNGTPLAVARILPGNGTLLALGFTGSLDQGDITVWRGTSGK
jgi:hypothetical protein